MTLPIFHLFSHSQNNQSGFIISLLPPLSFPSSVVHGISRPASFVCVLPFLTAAPCAGGVPSYSFLDQNSYPFDRDVF